jgi:polyhydroxyalkanoate synthesis regulator phasin
MAQDFEQLLREVFGDSLTRLTQFQSDQVKKLTTRLADMAREALKDDLSRLHAEIGELRSRVAVLEQERAQNAAESVESSF